MKSVHIILGIFSDVSMKVFDTLKWSIIVCANSVPIASQCYSYSAILLYSCILSVAQCVIYDMDITCCASVSHKIHLLVKQ